MWELEGAMISQGVRVVYHEPVAATLVKEAILGEIDTNNPHVPEDLQPTQRPVLLADVIAQWHL